MPTYPYSGRRRFLVRSALITSVVLGILTHPFFASAQPPPKVLRIGFLGVAGRTPDGAPPRPLREELRALGYIDGQTVAYEARFAEGKAERLAGLAAELVRIPVDVIVAAGGLAAAARIAVLWNANDPGMTLRYREIEKAAQLLRVEVQALSVRQPEDFAGAFAAMARSRPDAMFLVSDALTRTNAKLFIEFAATHRIPAMCEYNLYVRDGGLMSYGPSPEDGYRQGARYIDRIVKGAKPADLPAEQPTQYYLAVNLKTATTLGLTFPPSLVLRTDEVVQ